MKESAALVICIAAALGLVFISGCDAGDKKKQAEQASHIQAAKSSAIPRGLKLIGDGAMIYYQEEHPSADGLHVSTATFPTSKRADCIGGDESPGKVWDALRISELDPPDAVYCYVSSADGKGFSAWAEQANTLYCLRGRTNASGSPSLTAVTDHTDVSDDFECP